MPVGEKDNCWQSDPVESFHILKLAKYCIWFLCTFTFAFFLTEVVLFLCFSWEMHVNVGKMHLVPESNSCLFN